MYLAKHLAGWSTTIIGRFYNGRDHSTVIHGIQRIEALRESDSDLDALLSELKDQLTRRQDGSDEKKVFEAPTKVPYASYINIDERAEAVADRVWARISGRIQPSEPE
jgi:hypothetical protein